jgi:hypothetical protein
LSGEQQDMLKDWIEKECGIAYQVRAGRAAAPASHGASQAEGGVAQAKSVETGRLYQGV